ncbi:MAG: Crp/Fnr family transcriptional regulator [Chitinophagaceae bacterium]
MSIHHLFPFDKWNFKTGTVLHNLPEEDINLLMAHHTVQSYDKGQLLFKEGMIPSGIFLIRDGIVKKFRSDNNGREQIIYVAAPGELIGYHALLSEERYPDSAAALEKCVISFIPKEDFLATIQQSAEFNKRLLKTLSHEFTVLINNMSALSQKSVRERLALQLIILREKFKNDFKPGMDVTIDISREDLAAVVGTGREHAIRLLSELKEDGIVETKGSKIIIKNVGALLQIVNL